MLKFGVKNAYQMIEYAQVNYGCQDDDFLQLSEA